MRNKKTNDNAARTPDGESRGRANRRVISQAPKELGFGKHVTTSGRFMKADGQFNVYRQSLTPWDNAYYWLITIPAWQFFVLTFLFFGVLNAVFAALYVLIGIEQLSGIEITQGWMDGYSAAFFFSSQTLTTVGYGMISPKGFGASVLASFESFLGLLSFALISGLLYGRFSRPTARVKFSDHILGAPYKDGRALMFRMANTRRSELIEAEVQWLVAINQRAENGELFRRFYTLEPEIARISFFSMSWTIVHALDEKSPLYGFAEKDLEEGMAEFLVLVKATDEANEQVVHARRSYIPEEIVWDARFKPMTGKADDGRIWVMTSQVGDFERLGE